MAKFLVRGRTAATATTADKPIAAIWNPGTARVKVHQFSVSANVAPVASASFYVARLTGTRGTAGATVTPTAANNVDGSAAPTPLFLLDLATYSVDPSVIGTPMAGVTLGAVAGSMGVVPLYGGVDVPSGQGLGLFNGNAVSIPASDVNVVVET